MMQAHELLKHMRVPDVWDVRDSLRSVSTSTLLGVGAFSALTAYWYITRPRALPPPCDLSLQSLPLPGTDLARRAAILKGGDLLSHYYDDATTMYECFQRGLRESNDGPCLGSRKPKQPYSWLSYSEVISRAESLGSAFVHSGHSRDGDPHIGIFSQNRPEWTIAELACYTFSLVAVPLYDTLGDQAISYIIDKACIATVVCDVRDKAELLLNCVSDRVHSVRTIVLMEEPDAELLKRGESCGVQVISLTHAESIGQAHPQTPVLPQPDDLAIICFTSGTTGNPKGAMLTHRNIVSNTAAFTAVTRASCPLGPDDVHVSYLPLAHMFERVVQGVTLVHGARIGYFSGDIRRLMDDLVTLKPTIFPIVPRLLNRISDKIYGQANSGVKRAALDFCFRQKEKEMKNGIMRRDSLWDSLIFKKVQDSVGGHVRMMVTGAAPISAPVLTFLRAALGCQFYEGYGQTECTAGTTTTLPGDWTAGHVGAPLPCNDIKLVDVLEMNYCAANGEGEVCVRGPNVFLGYLKDPSQTEEALDQDGWVHTGDVGKWLPNGTLKIIDRKKHIFKLAQGEYIAPEKIENIYIQSEAVAQAFIHGDSLQACLVGIIVLDPDFLPSWARKRGLEGTYEELCASEAVRVAVLEDIVRLGKEGGLKSFEQVKAITLHTEMFSIQNGLLTPTLKAKRAELRTHFRTQIDLLYSSVTP